MIKMTKKKKGILINFVKKIKVIEIYLSIIRIISFFTLSNQMRDRKEGLEEQMGRWRNYLITVDQLNKLNRSFIP